MRRWWTLLTLPLLPACAGEAPGQVPQESGNDHAEIQRPEDRPGQYPEREREEVILSLLRAAHGDSLALAETQIKATITFSDLNSDGRPEALAYVEGWGPGGVCGTSGCNLYIYTPAGKSYRQIGELFGYPPIRALGSRTNGWKDIAMWVQGGGIMYGYEAAVPFSDGRYAGYNLANPPARLQPPGTPGDTLIANRFTLGGREPTEGPPPPPFGPARQR